MKKKINVITLGCSKNVVDSEKVMAQLAAGGWDVVHDSDSTDARVVVVNTCGFIGDAKQESIDTILRCVAAKEAGLIDRLYVIGCLSERYSDELRSEIPEVDEYFGARDFTGVVRSLGCAWRDELTGERQLTTPPHYAYLKISEGCDRRCAFCAIPLIRGPHVSVPMERLEQEARSLAAKGVRELMVIAQDTTCYGLDLYGRRRLAELLERLSMVDGIEWIRLHYAYPAGFPQDVIDVMSREGKICNYLDIPFQHIADGQLRSMKRGVDRQGTMDLIARLREAIPGITLRTTLLTGYPGETEEEFGQLLEFVRQVRFGRLGVFPYSEEEGTWSAQELTDDVPEQVKQERVERIMELQREISLENNQQRVGRTEEVIVDGVQDGFYVCRGRGDSPEVDQEILVPAGEGATGDAATRDAAVGAAPGGSAREAAVEAAARDITAVDAAGGKTVVGNMEPGKAAAGDSAGGAGIAPGTFRRVLITSAAEYELYGRFV
ncbi:MAG: 30S ribosomal protein S12 methylthiotransferase RimO [Rikenellaceae bacterium]|nr:30S ribosomal protein S12 methylthiotransferase RimO [Rikenellaceae bacterium]